MAHTPGPWMVAENLYGNTASYEVYTHTESKSGKGGYTRICQITPKDQKANARLIAAAPELLEALEASRKAINTLDEDALGMETREDGHGGINYWPFKVELLHQIDTAIAKAKGEAR